ncbi:Uncharacterized membrane protein [Nocardioides terrae]|uniref:Uncharacterized membrane protein n=1 Tax=Nocardioides terrae TaxID=574651 RepID=A0A1I1KFW7_9ACTN|nr:hypothetical protein [Nocardioides terrae]SFC59697.1 Uncharacterized membrane protein [Nocardioides terrae]
MSTTPPDDPYGSQGDTPGGTPPSGPDYGAPPPSGPDYGQPPGGYGTPPPPPGGYGTPPPGGYGTPPPGGYGGGPAIEPWSVGNALGYAWRKFTQNIGGMLLLGLLVILASLILGGIGSVIDRAVFGTPDPGSLRQTGNAFSSLLGFVGQTIVGAVIVRGALDLTEGRPLEIGGLFGRIPWGPVFILAILVAIVETIGLVLCILPGIVAMFFLSFATYFLIDRDLSPVDAMKESVTFVWRNAGKALIWAIVAFVVTIVGFCLFCVGIIATIPIALVGTAFTYKKLTGQPVAP